MLVAHPRFRISSRKARTRACVSAFVGGNGIRMPIRRTRSPWARATSRHEITAPPKMPTKVRRLMSPPALRSAYRSDQTWVAGRGKRLVSAAVAPAPTPTSINTTVGACPGGSSRERKIGKLDFLGWYEFSQILLEFFDPRSHFDFPGPSAAWLAQHVPITGGDCIRIEHGVWFICWFNAPRAANAAVDHEMRDVDALGRQFSGHALCKTAQRELTHRKSSGLRIALHARRCAGEKNGTMSVREHAARGLLRDQKASKRADSYGLRNIGRDQIDQCATRAFACIIYDDIRRTAVAFRRGK